MWNKKEKKEENATYINVQKSATIPKTRKRFCLKVCVSWIMQHFVIPELFEK